MTMALTATWAQGPNNTKTYYEAANGKSGQALKTALSGIIKNGHDPIGYNDNMYEAYKNTDTRPDGKVRDWYSNATNFTHVVDKAGSYKNEGDCYNREHTLPQSWFESYGEASTIKCDIIHVVPTDGKINGMRGNVPLAEVNPSRIAGQSKNGYSKWGMCGVSGYSGTVFEPNDEIKGDIARIYFYVVTRYENTATKWANNATASAVFNGSSAYQPFKQWYFDMLVRWAQNDPVDDLEIARNNAVYEEQGNRNPFVDYPGLEDYIWGEKKNEAFDYKNFDGSTTTVSMPTFSPEGGTYSSAQSVTISCPTNGATIFYTTDGTTPSASGTQYTAPVTVGESLTLKAIAVKDGEQSSVATATYVIREQGDDPTPSGDNIFKLITSTSELESGKRYLIVSEENAKALMKLDGTAGSGQVTVSSNTIDLNNSQNKAMVLTFTNVGTYWTISGSGSYMALTSDKNGLDAATSASENTAKWTISISSDGTAAITNVQYSPRSLKYNSGSDMFRCYKTGQQAVSIFKETSMTTTGINSTKRHDEIGENSIYNLQGQQIIGSPKKKGIYVSKGKKWIVK